jgi:hypothetical protein
MTVNYGGKLNQGVGYIGFRKWLYTATRQIKFKMNFFDWKLTTIIDRLSVLMCVSFYSAVVVTHYSRSNRAYICSNDNIVRCVCMYVVANSLFLLSIGMLFNLLELQKHFYDILLLY